MPDYEQIVGLFENNCDSFGYEKSKKTPMSKQKYVTKLNAGAFDEFNKSDFYHYFKDSARCRGITYRSHAAKDQAIFGRLLKEFDPFEIKDMIDFLFRSGQDIIDYTQAGVWIFSSSWLNTIYQNSLLWKEGNYKRKKKVREYESTNCTESVKRDTGKKKGRITY